MKDFKHQYKDGWEPDMEKGGGEKLVEAAGYIPAEVQIRTMIDAGMRLSENRKELYDYEGEIDDNVDLGQIDYDFTRSPNVDFADVSQAKLRNDARLKSQAEASKNEKIVDKIEKEEVVS